MADAEWTTIRIRVRAVNKIDEIRKSNSTAGTIPSKTSRTDVVEAALELYARAFDIERSAAEPAPKKRTR